MKIARALLAGASLLAPPAWAGEVSNVSGTLDTTLVDPAPSQYPHFICASGCSGGGGGGGGGGAVTQSGAWWVGVTNFPATQAVTGTVSIANLPATQPISALSLPLPTGAAIAANQPSLDVDGGGLAHITNFPATQAVTGSVSVGNFPATQAVTGSVSVVNLPATQAITASSLPLPTGAATAANQPSLDPDGGGLAHITNFPATQAVTGTVSVGNFPASQAVTGSVSVVNLPATQAITASSLPLPTGAATAANQPSLDPDGGGLAHITNFPATQAVTGTVSVGNFPASQAVTGSVSVANLPATQAISAASLPLPSGAATAANQPSLDADGGGLAHITNLPATQAVTGSVTLSGSLPGFATPPNVVVSNAYVTVAPAMNGFPDGWNPTEGSTSDSAWTSGAGSIVSLLKTNAVALNSILTSLNQPTPAGTNTIGNVGLSAGTQVVGQVGISQGSPGVSNAVQAVGVAPSYSTAYEACHVMKASSGSLFSISGVVSQPEYIMVFNLPAAPSSGTLSGASIPVWQGYSASSGYWGVSFSAPLTLTNGGVVCYSSTGGFNYTPSSVNNTLSGQMQ